MTVKEIVKLYLEANGYDGLCCDGCGCRLDDLCPCESGAPDNPLDCVPGYRRRDPDEPQFWVIMEDKP